MKRYSAPLLAAVSGLMLMVACKPSPEKINVSPDNIQLNEKGASAPLTAEAVDKNGAKVEGVAITWSSSAPDVASVDEGGKVTAVGSGSATVTAHADKLSADVPVTVSIPAKLNVDKTQLTLTPEASSDTVTATVMTDKDTPFAGQAKIVWTSADPKVATVDENGKVTGVGPGTTTVSATFNALKADVAVTSSVPAAAPAEGAAPADGAAAAPAPGAAPAPAAPATK